VAVELWSEEQTREMWRQAARYEPGMSEDRRDSLIADWRRAVERSRDWASNQETGAG
jgi:glycerol kinase